MTVPMMILVGSIIVGWLLLGHQSLILPVLSESINIVALLATLSVLIAGLAIAYVCFLYRRETTLELVQKNVFLRATTTLLLHGLGFDMLYADLQKWVIMPLVRNAKKIQSGVLGNNVALLLSALVVIVLLIASGVI
jgi:hypothetical protein